MKKILFITGTRADYGKIKSLMRKVKKSKDFELYVFITGMHLLSNYGSTYKEIEKDGFGNLYYYINQSQNTTMDIALSNTITGLSNYVTEKNPDLIVIHGDRLEAMAGAIVGAFNNILVAHIEGGEVSGTIDESIRHSITKLAHIHLVSNEESKQRIIQMGEKDKNIFVIGSPDIDIMYSNHLPALNEAKRRYDIPFDDYAIVMYHPVTTEYDLIEKHINNLVEALVASKKNYIIIFPNNDYGNKFIINAYKKLYENEHFKIFPSIRFEYFLTLMKHANFVIGNSSAGIRESTAYGVPTIDLGSRQKGRYNIDDNHLIQHVEEDTSKILKCIRNIQKHELYEVSNYGLGDSADKFFRILDSDELWNIAIQKKFNDI